MSIPPCEASLYVLPVYQHVINEVIQALRSSDDVNIDDQVLKELKETWEANLFANKAVRKHVPAMPSTSHQAGASTSRKGWWKRKLPEAPAVTQPIPEILPPTPTAPGPSGGVEMVSLQIQFPGRVRDDGEDSDLVVQVPASSFQGNPLLSSGQPLVLPDAVIQQSMNLPKPMARFMLEEYITNALKWPQQAVAPNLGGNSGGDGAKS